jgi:arylformamidase
VDAPTHFLKAGLTIDQLPLDSLIGECVVIDCSSVAEKITVSDLEKHADCFKVDIFLVIKTKNSEGHPTELFDHNFVYIDKSAAQYIVSKKFKGIGFDYLGIERAQPLHETHAIFMQNNITIIEGLRLKDIDAGSYTLICLPLLVVGSEAAPARAVLMR